MGVVYGLYSTRDAQVRCVDQAEDEVQKCLDMVTTKALDQEVGPIFEWMRQEWREGFEIRGYVLQDEISLDDLEMFEGYWIDQFSGLLNAPESTDSSQPTSEVGKSINAAILAELKGRPIS